MGLYLVVRFKTALMHDVLGLEQAQAHVAFERSHHTVFHSCCSTSLACIIINTTQAHAYRA